jgi:hypothetical protein
LAAGKIPIQIIVDEISVAEALIVAGLLSESEREDRAKISRALEKAIAFWVHGVVTP